MPTELVAAVAVQGMEVFSTVLWHLKEELALSHLAQQVIAQDRQSPHAWAVLGNCFSLQKVWCGDASHFGLQPQHTWLLLVSKPRLSSQLHIIHAPWQCLCFATSARAEPSSLAMSAASHAFWAAAVLPFALPP